MIQEEKQGKPLFRLPKYQEDVNKMLTMVLLSIATGSGVCDNKTPLIAI